MSDSITQHPFWNYIEDWHSKHGIPLGNAWDKEWGDSEFTEMIGPDDPGYEDHLDSAVGEMAWQNGFSLWRAIDGGNMTKDGHDRLGIVLRFVVFSSVGVAVGRSAATVALFSPRAWAAFAASARLEGFINAIEAYSRLRHPETDSVTELVNLSERPPKRQVIADFLVKEALQSLKEGGLNEFQRLKREILRTHERNRKKSSRRKTTSKQGSTLRSEVRFVVEHYWITHALWCRSTGGICYLFWPKGGKESAQIHNWINRAISDFDLSNSRRNEHENQIEKAESIAEGE